MIAVSFQFSARALFCSYTLLVLSSISTLLIIYFGGDAIISLPRNLTVVLVYVLLLISPQTVLVGIIAAVRLHRGRSSRQAVVRQSLVALITLSLINGLVATLIALITESDTGVSTLRVAVFFPIVAILSFLLLPFIQLGVNRIARPR